MKKLFSALAMIAITVFSLSGCSDKSTETDSTGKGKATDYSRKESWLQLPEIMEVTKFNQRDSL